MLPTPVTSSQPGSGRERGVVVERPHRPGDAVVGVDRVDVVGAHVSGVALRRDVVERVGVALPVPPALVRLLRQLVDPRVGEAEPARALRDRLHARHERRGEARAADAVLAVVTPAGPKRSQREVLRLADQHAGRRVAVHARCRERHGPAAFGGTTPSWYHGPLEDCAEAAARAVVERDRRRPGSPSSSRPSSSCPSPSRRGGRCPADRERRAADGGHPRVAGREVRAA